MNLKDLVANYLQDKGREIANDPNKKYEDELNKLAIDLIVMPQDELEKLLGDYKEVKLEELQAAKAGLEDQKNRAEASLNKDIGALTELDVKVVSVKDPGVILKK